MAKALSINHVTLIVENLEEAAAFYEYELGMEPIPSFVFDYPTAFFKINEKQQLHLSEWEDAQSFRGHVCLDVDDFDTLFFRFKELGIIDINSWGNVRQMPDGSMQMFVRDPSGNLVECISHPTYKSSPEVMEDELFKAGIYVSGRNDFRGYKNEEATLHHAELDA